MVRPTHLPGLVGPAHRKSSDASPSQPRPARARPGRTRRFTVRRPSGPLAHPVHHSRASRGHAGAAHRGAARRAPGRRVLLAAPPRGPRGHRLPRGGEPVHRGDDERHRAAAGAALLRDARADQGNRPVGAGAAGRLAVLLAHPGGRAVPDLLPPPGGQRGRGRHPARPESAGRGARLLPAGRVRDQPRPPPAGLRGRHQRRRGVHGVREGPGHRRAAGRDAHQQLAQPGVGQRQPDAVLRGAGRGAPALPAVPPHAGHQPGRGRAGPLRAGRGVLPRRPALPEPRVPDPRAGQPCHLGGVVRQRRPARPAVPGDRAAAAGHRVHGGPPRQPVLHHHQRRRPQLPAGLGAGLASVARAVDRRAALSPRGQAGFHRRVPGSPGGVGAGGGATPDPDRRVRRRRGAPGALPRAGVHRAPAREPRVRHRPAPVQLHLDGHPEFGGGLRHEGAHLDGAEADRGARRVRRGPVPERAAVRHGAGRHAGAGLAGLPAPAGAPWRPAAAAAQRLRRVRHQLGPVVLVEQPEPARPGLRGGHRPRAGRRGDGPALVRRREAAEQAEQLHRLHRRGGAPGGRGVHQRPSGWPSAAAARAGC